MECDVIVGASSGLGAALAAHLLSNARRPLVLTARRYDRLQEIVGEYDGREYETACIRTDLQSPEQTESLGRVIGKFGFVRNLFLVAAANEPEASGDYLSRQKSIETYLRLLFTTWVPLVESLEHDGHISADSTIVAISSIAAGIPFNDLPMYCAGKAALEQWMRSTRRPSRARRVVVRPGRFNSEFFGPTSMPTELPMTLAATICERVQNGDDEIYLGSVTDRWSSRLQRAAQVVGEILVKDASKDSVD